MNTLIIPDCIPSQMLATIDEVWPSTDWDGWYEYRGAYGSKLASLHHQCLPCPVVGVAGIIAAKMLDWKPSILVDWSFHGAGMHQINPGGSLPPHYDADMHAKKMLRRSISAVCFLDTIAEKFGGTLTLEGREKIQPVRGTLVMFETTNCLHEVTKLAGECDTPRRTIAVFGYEAMPNCESGLSRSATFVTG